MDLSQSCGCVPCGRADANVNVNVDGRDHDLNDDGRDGHDVSVSVNVSLSDCENGRDRGHALGRLCSCLQSRIWEPYNQRLHGSH